MKLSYTTGRYESEWLPVDRLVKDPVFFGPLLAGTHPSTSFSTVNPNPNPKP